MGEPRRELAYIDSAGTFRGLQTQQRAILALVHLEGCSVRGDSITGKLLQWLQEQHGIIERRLGLHE